MRVYRSADQVNGELSGCALAIGNFDGVHLGHRRLADETRALAGACGGESALLTFEPHPARVLAPQFAPLLLTTPARKLALLEEAGFDAVIVQPFDRAYADRSPDAFVREDVLGAIAARHLIVGHDFSFGRSRAGNPELLARLVGEAAHVHVVPAVTADGLVVSSSKIRELLLDGRVAPATRLLGHPHLVDGRVVAGRGRGRTIGVPTANVAPETELVPAAGVYAVLAAVEGEPQVMGGAANLGVKPTFGGGETTLEVHLLDVTLDLYGRSMAVAFLDRLRSEERFDSIEALVAQIHRDIERTRARLQATPALELRALASG